MHQIVHIIMEVKMNDLEFIKRFNDITITDICKDLEYNSRNIYSGRAKQENIENVRKVLEYKIRKLLFDAEYEKLNVKKEELEVI